MSLNRTKIEWVKNPDGTQGFTCNLITGCVNHNNGLCKGGGFPCYAYKLAHGRLKSRYLANTNTAIKTTRVNDEWEIGDTMGKIASADPFYPRFWVNRLEQADEEMKRAKEPIGVFFNDMSDWVGIGVPESWTDWTIELARRNPRHRIYTLTKQPQNLAKFSPFPDNCWVGVTATNTTMFKVALDYLNRIKATIKYISLEPFLEWNWDGRVEKLSNALKDINWLIIGSQTKPYKPPKIESVKEIVGATDRSGIPVFLKDNLGQALPRELAEAKGNTYPQGGWYPLRQEMPK